MSRRIRTLGALAATAALLAGCSTLPGTAAVVDGARISESDVADATAMFGRVLGATPNPAAVLDALVKEKVVTPVAGEFDLVASDGEVVDYLNQYAVSAGGEVLDKSEFPASGLAAGRYLAIMERMSSDENAVEISGQMLAAFQDADIELSPRYGTYDENGVLSASTFDWIHTTDAAAQ